jgi:hypothetical protein
MPLAVLGIHKIIHLVARCVKGIKQHRVAIMIVVRPKPDMGERSVGHYMHPSNMFTCHSEYGDLILIQPFSYVRLIDKAMIPRFKDHVKR